MDVGGPRRHQPGVRRRRRDGRHADLRSWPGRDHRDRPDLAAHQAAGPGAVPDRRGAGLDLRRDGDADRGRDHRRAGRAGAGRRLRHAQPLHLHDQPDGRDAHIVHDRLHPGGCRLPVDRHGLHRHPAPPGELGRRPGAVAVHAHLRAHHFLRAPRLLPRRRVDDGGQRRGGAADGHRCRHRPPLVRHLRRDRRRDGADHPAGRVQPVRAPVHDRTRHHGGHEGGDSVLLPDGAGDCGHHCLSGDRDLPAQADGQPVGSLLRPLPADPSDIEQMANTASSCDLLIRDALILTLDADDRIIAPRFRRRIRRSNRECRSRGRSSRSLASREDARCRWQHPDARPRQHAQSFAADDRARHGRGQGVRTGLSEGRAPGRCARLRGGARPRPPRCLRGRGLRRDDHRRLLPPSRRAGRGGGRDWRARGVVRAHHGHDLGESRRRPQKTRPGGRRRDAGGKPRPDRAMERRGRRPAALRSGPARARHLRTRDAVASRRGGGPARLPGAHAPVPEPARSRPCTRTRRTQPGGDDGGGGAAARQADCRALHPHDGRGRPSSGGRRNRRRPLAGRQPRFGPDCADSRSGRGGRAHHALHRHEIRRHVRGDACRHRLCPRPRRRVRAQGTRRPALGDDRRRIGPWSW